MANITITSVITGLHRTKISSHRDVKLIVENDDSLQDIPDCVMVKVPTIDNIPPELHTAVAYPKSRNPKDPRQRDILVRETANKKLGNVPANLCGLFRKFRNSGEIKDIYCFAVGERPQRSIRPATFQKYRRRPNRLDQRGGGMVLECQYILEIGTGNRVGIVNEIRNTITEMEGDETVF